MKALNNGLTKRLTRLEHDFIEHESFVNALTLDDWHFEAGDGFFDAGVDPVEGVQCANSEVLESPLILVDNSSRSLSISLNTGISNRQYLGLRQQDNEETDDAENTEYSCRAADPSEEVQIKSSFEKRFSFNLPSLTTSLTTSSSHEFEGDDDQHIEESNNVRDLRSRPAQAIGDSYVQFDFVKLSLFIYLNIKVR